MNEKFFAWKDGLETTFCQSYQNYPPFLRFTKGAFQKYYVREICQFAFKTDFSHYSPKKAREFSVAQMTVFLSTALYLQTGLSIITLSDDGLKQADDSLLSTKSK